LFSQLEDVMGSIKLNERFEGKNKLEGFIFPVDGSEFDQDYSLFNRWGIEI